MAELPPSDNRFEIIERGGWFRRRYQCGHHGPRWFRVHSYGVDTLRIRQKKYCPECWLERAKQHIIRCALCGLPITPGAPVSLYGPDSNLNMSIATVVPNGDIIGCMRWECCLSGGFFAGHWTEHGFKAAFDGGHTAVAEVFATGKTITTNI